MLSSSAPDGGPTPFKAPGRRRRKKKPSNKLTPANQQPATSPLFSSSPVLSQQKPSPGILQVSHPAHDDDDGGGDVIVYKPRPQPSTGGSHSSPSPPPPPPPKAADWFGALQPSQTILRGSKIAKAPDGNVATGRDSVSKQAPWKPVVHVSNQTQVQVNSTVINGPKKKTGQMNRKGPKRSSPSSPPPLITGDYPDVYWRAIDMEDLRCHPCFDPLPHPSTIGMIHDAKDLSLFRQSSWQWDALHQARLTTSRLAGEEEEEEEEEEQQQHQRY